MKKTIIALMAAFFIIIHGIVCAHAEVYTTTEPTNGSCVYIAGNPDMYPIEYYDSKDKEYKGILPDIYRQISEESGIEFSYISAGTENEQSRLARNGQAELISAHAKGDIRDLTDELHIITLDNDGRELEICIGFTAIASPELVSAVTSGINAASGEDLARVAVKNASPYAPADFSFWIIFVTIEVFVLILLLYLSIIKRHKIERQATENKLMDPMTGIGNGLYFQQMYQNVITPVSASLYYIAYIGIDVKRIVQYFDASASEDIQVYAASEIMDEMTENDFCARISDGRFALAFEATETELAEEKLEELISKLNLYSSEVMTRFHAGLFHLDSVNIPCEKAISNARQGYHRARELGELYVLSDDDMLKREEHVLDLKKKLAKALEQKEFRLYTQYIFTGDGKTACGAEALSRWENPENGTIFPREYIEMLEAAKMIDALDFYILEECCRTLSEWANDSKKNFWLSCNVTGSTLSREDFMERFTDIIGRYTFDIHELVIEITEEALLENNEQVVSNIEQCKQLGCRIAIDDFGLGYSSVKDLVDHPIDIVKIDRQIISDCETERGMRLLFGIVRLAHFLGIEALCEGVENETELKNALASECDYIQGFLLARTSPADEASADRGISFAQ